MLTLENVRTHCQNCFVKLQTGLEGPFYCEDCDDPNVVYCSSKCREHDRQIHSYECRIYPDECYPRYDAIRMMVRLYIVTKLKVATPPPGIRVNLAKKPQRYFSDLMRSVVQYSLNLKAKS